MTELVRGTIGDRPWGFTLGALALRRLSGQLTLQQDSRYYCIAFDDGAIVGATSPLAGDSAARIALINHFATSPQIPAITRRIAASPDRDEIDVLAEMNSLTPDQRSRLRCRVIAQRAARTFSVDRGEFVVHDEITIATHVEAAQDVRAIVFLGARMNLPEQRLSDDLRPYGTQFQVRDSALAELDGFGFGESELAIVEAIRIGNSMPELEARYRDVDPRTLRAIVYALLSCGAVDAVTPNPFPAGPAARPITVAPLEVEAGAGFRMRERKPVPTSPSELLAQEVRLEPPRTATGSRSV
ncbi:MAG: hypothetical protein KIT31_43430, partial [Deltaproteobacteria bacterium]|nr:hypothetical protein [Deltaproteobacteria bacterium]